MTERQFGKVRRRLGAAIKKRRIERQMTQEDVADQLGVVTRHYQKIEAGALNLTLRTIVKVCLTLEMDLRDLF